MLKESVFDPREPDEIVTVHLPQREAMLIDAYAAVGYGIMTKNMQGTVESMGMVKMLSKVIPLQEHMLILMRWSNNATGNSVAEALGHKTIDETFKLMNSGIEGVLAVRDGLRAAVKRSENGEG